MNEDIELLKKDMGILMRYFRTAVAVNETIDAKNKAIRNQAFEEAAVLRNREAVLKDEMEVQQLAIRQAAEKYRELSSEKKTIVCSTCEGKGKVQQTDVDWDPCRRCNGTGRIKADA